MNFSYVFQAFGYVLTLVVVFNTVSINLHERHEELMIMRSMGARLREIAATITWESLTVTLLSIVISIPIGLFVGDILIRNYDLDFYGMFTTIAPRSYILAAVGLIVVVLFAEWLSLRGLQRDDLGALSKTLSM